METDYVAVFQWESGVTQLPCPDIGEKPRTDLYKSVMTILKIILALY